MLIITKSFKIDFKILIARNSKVWARYTFLNLGWFCKSSPNFQKCPYDQSIFINCNLSQLLSLTCLSVTKATLYSQMSVHSSICHKTPQQLEIIILHPSTFIILHSSFLHFATFKLFSLFIKKTYKFH